MIEGGLSGRGLRFPTLYVQIPSLAFQLVDDLLDVLSGGFWTDQDGVGTCYND
jgi:hypothetical protein